jgi:PDZ domain-containing protein
MSEPSSTIPVPPPVLPPRRRMGPWRIAGVVVAVVFGVAAIAANFIHVPYVIISPGDATPLDNQVITVSGARTYPHSGELLYLTVRVTDHDPNVWRWLFAKLNNDDTVEKKADVIGGCASYTDSARLNEFLMQASQSDAKTVALQHLGYPVTPMHTDNVVVSVVCGGPSDNRMHLGDVITAVDGHPVTTNSEIGPLVQKHATGDDVHLTVTRSGATRVITVRTGHQAKDPANPKLLTCARGVGGGSGAKTCVGIVTYTFTDEKFPFNIRINTLRVSGPSAGLSFALALIDDLTPGDITGGRRVAITGTIAADGTVGVVGGVEQKTVTARKAGATLMIVPTMEAKAARDHANGMRVVGVDNISEALAALRRAGGDPLPPQPKAPTGQ